MKKSLMMLAIIATCLWTTPSQSSPVSPVSFEVPEVSCMGGMTTCGLGYMICYEGAAEEPWEVQLIMWDVANDMLCN